MKKNDATQGFSADEKAAMKARIKEMKANRTKAEGEADVLAAIAAMPEADRARGERLHAIIKANGPGLSPKTWYGMPAYANEDGKVVCFFRSADKFKERYMTLGFNQEAKLDDGLMWPIVFALTDLTAEEEGRIATLVRTAVGG
ncbi:MAG TPA: hypothetical protein VHE55_11270 [Fimbriimonadaceae bacterium]|nr:hypothetical protein [Fimbriimonadaceae bacterium]